MDFSPPNEKPKLVRFTECKPHTEDGIAARIAKPDRVHVYRALNYWRKRDARGIPQAMVCRGRWYIKFSLFMLVGTDDKADNILEPFPSPSAPYKGNFPFDESWEITQSGEIKEQFFRAEYDRIYGPIV